MDLQTFPFDIVTCTLTFESFNYNIEDVQVHLLAPFHSQNMHKFQMNWTSIGVAKPRDKMELADFILSKITNRQMIAVRS